MRPADLGLAPGLRYRVLARVGDSIGPGLVFGADADYTAAFPLPNGHVLLWVNHEFPPRPDERFEQLLGRPPTGDDVLDCMGASILELRPAADGGWERVPESTRTWRLTGRTPQTRVTGPATSILGPEVAGTLQNCGGGVTPWGTVLTCEENTRYHTPDGVGTRDGRIGVGTPTTVDLPPTPGLRGEHYGWVVEADPKDPTWAPRRHTALARFRHESVALAATPGAPLVAYMGDDRAGGGVWRYTSRAAWSPGLDRDAGSALLTDGALAILRLDSTTAARWIPVSRATPVDAAARAHLPRVAARWKLPAPFLAALATAKTLGDLYTSEGALLVDAWLAGLCAGGSPLGRPEGCVWLDGRLHVALTDGIGLPADDAYLPPVDHPDGCILAVTDHGPTATVAVPVVAGQGFGNPDNLGEIDGVLVLCTDSGPPKAGWAQNSLIRVGPDGPERIVVAPPDAELCGPSLAPDGALFLAVQHPHPDWGESAVVCVWQDGDATR